MTNRPLLEVQEIKTFSNALNESWRLDKQDYANARILAMQARAARDVGIITPEMHDIILSLMCGKQREIEAWQKGHADDVEF